MSDKNERNSCHIVEIYVSKHAKNDIFDTYGNFLAQLALNPNIMIKVLLGYFQWKITIYILFNFSLCS